MSGEQAAGGGVGINPGTGGEGGGWGRLHLLAGYQASGGGLRAVCRCGHTGPPRAGEERAAAALDAQHRLDPLPCGVCERRRVPDTILCRPEEVGLVIRPAVAGPLLDIEYLACADDLSTWPGWLPSCSSGWPARSPRPTPTAAGCAGPTCD